MKKNKSIEQRLEEIEKELQKIRQLLEADGVHKSEPWLKPGPDPLNPWHITCGLSD